MHFLQKKSNWGIDVREEQVGYAERGSVTEQKLSKRRACAGFTRNKDSSYLFSGSLTIPDREQTGSGLKSE
jgi:hypothetical protein